MLGIKGIGIYLPQNKVDNVKQGISFGESEIFVLDKIGALHLPRKDKNDETSDLAVMAIMDLLRAEPDLSLEDIDALVLVTQNGDSEGLPHTSAIIQRKLNLPKSVAAFDISLGCSGYVYGLSILRGFLEVSNLKNGVLVTCDPYSKIIDPDDRNTAMLFGDAATATWIGENPLWEIKSVSYGTDGTGADHLRIENNKLHMNGRQVFNFAASHVADHIDELLRKNYMTRNDIDCYCLHQGSRAIIDLISKLINASISFLSIIAIISVFLVCIKVDSPISSNSLSKSSLLSIRIQR
jgi:3-oxoacyl-[acyl-carrier-protein] synthase-3